jgi:hypothetical protein
VPAGQHDKPPGLGRAERVRDPPAGVKVYALPRRRVRLPLEGAAEAIAVLATAAIVSARAPHVTPAAGHRAAGPPARRPVSRPEAQAERSPDGKARRPHEHGHGKRQTSTTSQRRIADYERDGLWARAKSAWFISFVTASSRTDGTLYLFTAGHCAVEVPNGATNRWATGFANLTGHVIGTMHHYIWGPSGDEAILNINNPSGWELPQGWVAVMAGSNTTLNEEYPISSAQYSTQGARVCESGEASGSICGTVEALGVSWCYGPKGQKCAQVNNLGEASFCGNPDDSGAPVFAAHQAFGMVVALQTNIYGNCAGGTFYQGIVGASDAMNVNVVPAHLPVAATRA